jgi:hypothetical protein
MRILGKAAVAALAFGVLAGPALAADNPAAGKDISRQAYLDHAAKRFDAMDSNKDGVLSGAERKAAFQNHRHHRHGAASTVAPSTAPTDGSK